MTWKQLEKAKEFLLASGFSYDTLLQMSVTDIMKRYEQMKKHTKPNKRRDENE